MFYWQASNQGRIGLNIGQENSQAQIAKTAAADADGAAPTAGDAAEQGKILASEAQTAASTDPSAVDDAQKAVDLAVKLIDLYDKTKLAATAANDAATLAEAVVGPIFGTGGTGNP